MDHLRFNQINENCNRRSTKVTVVGAGNVGMTVVQGLLVHKLADEIVVFDWNRDRLKGEMMDIHYAGAYLPLGKIHFSDKYSATANSDLCIMATGIVKKSGESRYDLLNRNIEKFKKLVPAIVDYSPNCVILVVSNPVDLMTHMAWKLSGLSAGRVFGAGTNLDSSTYQFLIGGHLNVSAQDVKAFIVGEHGQHSIPLLSNISVGGAPIMNLFDSRNHHHVTNQKETLHKLHKDVVTASHEVSKLKGQTSVATACSVVSLARSVLCDQRRLHPVSLLSNGFYGIGKDDVFLSLPALLGKNGVVGVPELDLSHEELARLRDTARDLHREQAHLGKYGSSMRSKWVGFKRFMKKMKVNPMSNCYRNRWDDELNIPIGMNGILYREMLSLL